MSKQQGDIYSMGEDNIFHECAAILGEGYDICMNKFLMYFSKAGVPHYNEVRTGI